ncbi:unnamed protein product [Cuscuta europaea]|uniref:Uncharacterized protein n=1 Tax=Cuscuta europaea TaxID=41803 RepID=A0A9P1E436_CUSEU|nr:unnamed protein product [Cuscuta europaea]
MVLFKIFINTINTSKYYTYILASKNITIHLLNMVNNVMGLNVSPLTARLSFMTSGGTEPVTVKVSQPLSNVKVDDNSGNGGGSSWDFFEPIDEFSGSFLGWRCVMMAQMVEEMWLKKNS